MATAIQWRRGNTAQHANFTGLVGEITVDTEKNTVVVHDGVTAGGTPLATSADVEAIANADITAVITPAGSGLTGGTLSGEANLALDYENLQGNLVPSANNTYSLGSASKVWKDVFVGPGSLYIDGQKVLESDAGTIVFTADPSQNISVVTSNGADIELNTGETGSIQLKGNVVLNAGKTFTTAGGGAFTFTSNITLDSNHLNDLSDPVQSQDAATKNYVDTAASVVHRTGAETIAGVKTFSDNVIMNGNLTVTGTTTTVNSETISLADNIIDLNSNFTTGSPTENAGIRILRGDETAAQIRWNEANDYWETVDGTGATKIALDTDDLAEGSTNVYYTDARAQAAISVTDNGGDGSLTYNSTTGVLNYTGPSAAEVRAHFSAGTGVTITDGVIAVSQAMGSGDDVTFNTVTADLTGNVTGNVTGNLTGDVTGDVTGNIDGTTGSFSSTVDMGDLQVGTHSSSTSSTTQTAVASFSATAYRSARFTVQVTNTTDDTYQTTEILVLHDGTTAYVTEFGTLHTGAGVEATFSADVSGGNVRLLATPQSANSMTFKTIRHSMTV